MRSKDKSMYDLVTFDIFDTLVHRKLRAPVDVFEAVRIAVLQNNIALLNHDILASFSHQRMQAEKEARDIFAAASNAEGEINLDEIYHRYEVLSGCSSELRQLLQTKELELEKTFLFASKKRSRDFRRTPQKNKKARIYFGHVLAIVMVEGGA